MIRMYLTKILQAPIQIKQLTIAMDLFLLRLRLTLGCVTRTCKYTKHLCRYLHVILKS